MTDPADVCLSKIPYRNRRIANRQAKHMTELFGVWHKAYECPVCFQFHTKTLGFVGQPSIRKPLRGDYLNERNN